MAKRASGRNATAAIGRRRRVEATEAEVAVLLATPPADPPEVRARRLLEAHRIDPLPAHVDTALEHEQLRDLLVVAHTEAPRVAADTKAKLIQAAVACSKQRRTLRKDLGLPADPDEREDFRRPPSVPARESAPTPPRAPGATESDDERRRRLLED